MCCIHITSFVFFYSKMSLHHSSHGIDIAAWLGYVNYTKRNEKCVTASCKKALSFLYFTELHSQAPFAVNSCAPSFISQIL